MPNSLHQVANNRLDIRKSSSEGQQHLKLTNERLLVKPGM
jgi:hypothetical protein